MRKFSLLPMSVKPENLSRVLVEFESGVLEFAYYKDGMFQYNDKWYLPDEFNGWISINNLKRAINIFSNIF